MTRSASPRADIHTRVTDRILADLEQGVRPWFKPWNAGNTKGRITRRKSLSCSRAAAAGSA